MLISPPFLPARNAAETESDWLDRCMAGGEPGDGAYPLSFNLGWHGGMHLVAPGTGTTTEPVRAIADGTVVFRRNPTPQPAGPLPPDHPQAYHGGWTDNGVVVIRHDTEIGEGANGTVRFFSIYMHLREIDAAVSTTANGGRIYRKTLLGQAGQVYGSQDARLHIEIVCDDDNLRKLVGRDSGDLPLDADGRTDVLFGEMYVHVPAGAQVYGQRPLDHSVQAMMQPPTPRGQPRPAPVALQAVGTTDVELIIGLRYAGGEGAAGHRGSLFVTSYRVDGTTVGDPLEEADADYDLYDRAKSTSEAYPATGRPAQSAVYELLRYGRVVGPDALTPNDVPHWRQVRHNGGQGWINLNDTGLHKFSDADFPHWKRWCLIDDSADQDSRCDSPVVRGWLDSNSDGKVVPSEANTRLADADMRPRLAGAICKFVTEWNAATIDARWGWLKTASDELLQPLSNEDFELLRAHITALAFWPGGMGLPEAHWRFQPREFIRQFRKSGWMSLDELSQMLPRRSGATNIAWATARTRFTPYQVDLNKAFRKYLVQNATRQIHFLAQTFIETAMWRTVEEIGRAHQQQRANGTWYWPAPAMQYYGAFYGRGIMQLTWAGNYEAYGLYRQIPNAGAGHTYADNRITQTSQHYWADPRNRQGVVVQQPRQWAPRYDPALIATQSWPACDSGCFYWVSKNTGGGALNINRVCDQGVTTAAVGRASVLVNGGGYGFAERQAYAPYIERYRGDSTDQGATTTFTVTRGTTVHTINVNFTPQRP